MAYNVHGDPRAPLLRASASTVGCTPDMGMI